MSKVSPFGNFSSIAKPNLKFFREFPSAIAPSIGSKGAAGMDFFIPKPIKTDLTALEFMRKKCLESVAGTAREDEESRTINMRFDSYIKMDPEVGFLEGLVQYNARLFGHIFKLAFPNTMSKYIQLAPGESITIPSGLSASIPHGWCLEFMNKSGVASKSDLLVGACLIDEDYKGIMHYNLHNVGYESRQLFCGQKIVQAVIHETYYDEIDITVHDGHIDETSDRGDGGFGSTGTDAKQ